MVLIWIQKNINNFLSFKKELEKKYIIKIILSSDWKYENYYNIALWTYNIKIENTTKLTFEDKEEYNKDGWILFNNLEKLRVKEIKDYIKNNNILNYIVIDDMDLKDLNNFYKTNPLLGFIWNEQIIKI